MFKSSICEVTLMVTRRRKKRKLLKVEKKSCICGSCDDPDPHLPGYLIMAIGAMFLPISFGFLPEYDFLAKGWPILLFLFGMVLVAKATLCNEE